jgi:glycosyltransferase involved in cell wall biosynthesis
MVSVVIPTCDRPAMLRAAVRSVTAQRGVSTEIIVVDDGSRPAASLEPPGVPLTVLRHEYPRGDAEARNVGAAAARGSWIAFLDDDDLWAPDKLIRQLVAADRAGASFAYAGALAVSPAGRVIARLPAPPVAHLRARLLERNVIPAGASNVILTAELFRATGGYDTTLRHLSDWDLWVRLAASAPGVGVDGELVAYRYHAGNRSFDDPATRRRDFEVLDTRYAAQRAALGVRLDRTDFARYLAWGARQRGRRAAAARGYLGSAVRLGDPGTAVRGLAVLLGERFMRRMSGGPPPEPAPHWAVGQVSDAQQTA